MSNLISRQAVEEMIKAEMPERGMWEIEGDKEKETVCEVCVDLMQKLSELPSVENKGTWRHYEGMLYCPKCGAEFYDEIMEYTGDKVPKFCPDCGADMRGE